MKVILIAALTIDGKIGLHSEHFPDWTEQADKKMFMQISKNAGVIIIGSKTFDTFGAPLPGRKHIVMTRNPARRSETGMVTFTNQKPAEILSDLEKKGYTEVILGGGSRIYTLFATEGLIDEILVTISPKVFGTGISLFSDTVLLDLSLIEFRKLGEHTIFARYHVVRKTGTAER
jgi:dihydrofolate reductase